MMVTQRNIPITDSPFEDEYKQLLVEDLKIDDTTDNKLDSTLDCYPDKRKKEALHRLAYIQWFERRLQGGWTEKNIQPLIEEAALSLGPPVPNWLTLTRWHKNYIQNGQQVTALIPKHHEKGNKASRLTPDEESFIYDAIKGFLTLEKPSIAKIHQLYCDKIKVANIYLTDNKIKAISYKSFNNRIKKIPIYDFINKRKGAYAADIECRAVGTHIPPSRIMERVELDHTPLDLILLDDELLAPLGRPSLTLMIDAYSHCVVGYNLCFSQPSYESVSCALIHSISTKEYVKEKYPLIKNVWPCYGKPEILVVDNGAEFWSTSLEQACLELGINIHYNPVRKPWLKPLIERMFGTINHKLLESIPGKTFSNVMEKENYNPQKDAVMRLSSFLEIFHQWIIDVYHCEADSRYQYIPLLLWEMSIKMFPPAVIEGIDLKHLEIVLSISIYRKHRRSGIQIHHLHYDSDELASYRMNYSSESKGKKKVLVKLNPRDVSYIFVFIEEEGKYIRISCIDPCNYTKGLSLQQHLINIKLHRDFISSQIDSDSLSKVRIYIHERIEKEISDVRKNLRRKPLRGMKKIACHQGIGSQAGTTVAFYDIPARKKENGLKNGDATQSLIKDWDNLLQGIEPFD
ncbi:Mu transposase C-terminal domain-containing protein [Klebsiella oxytoca]|uniref:Mu transposase C-terminal domain-containing protein n=1 Tax=Klebsiella oxytoca TaxID=571 RepID=UPI00357176EC